MTPETFQPWPPLIEGKAESHCRSIVILPAKDEEASLGASLDALAAQVDLQGEPLRRDQYEILLLLNNCTDQSFAVASRWQDAHTTVRLHIAERVFESDQAYVGTARRMLMDTAWRRLQGQKQVSAILSTDSDTLVADDWVARNMAAFEGGADAVGGMIELKRGELENLPEGARAAYLKDRSYQLLVAQLEDLLDPQDGDPWPRHLEHFGASLGCTPDIYARAGGMPPVTPLEDVAFVGRLRDVGARLRHDPSVRVYTSSRMEGRVKVGLSGQLTLWQEMSERGEEHCVQSADWLAHRFRTLSRLRAEAILEGIPAASYLSNMDCDKIVLETFCVKREGEITEVIHKLTEMITELNR